jgi:NSS family neurotransmitter:Na+ symporter
MSGDTGGRGHWGSRLGFILAAAGSAVGLGNIWKFPYITGTNGGGLFVLIYLGCIAAIGLPIMIAEVMVGRRAQRSPVGAFQRLRGEETTWRIIGWMGVVTGFIILSYYSVVAGWAMNYALMSIGRAFEGKDPGQIQAMFGTLYGSPGINLFWHAAFMVITVAIVIGGVKKGIESWARVLMPALFALLLVLLFDAFLQDGFGKAARFVFSPSAENLSPEGVLEALGHSFFTLSLGMGALLTYGSYLKKDDDIVGASFMVTVLDTVVALMACLILFPVIFSYGMEPSAGPGLVFASLPVAFSQMTGGMLLSIMFFILLVFAALTSAISLLEVVVSTVIDQLGWSRRKAVIVMGTAVFLFGIPSALSGWGWFSANWAALFGKNFFDTFDYLASNWLLPLGGFFIAVFVGWVMPMSEVKEEFSTGSKYGGTFSVWYFAIKFLAPLAVGLLFLYAVGVIEFPTHDMFKGMGEQVWSATGLTPEGM